MLTYLEKQSNTFILITGYMVLMVLGILDYLTGYELSFSLFYLAPISLIAWFAGQKNGMVISLASAITWHEVNGLAGEVFSNPFISYWNTFIRLGFFMLFTMLLSKMRLLLEKEKATARTDFLTGAMNSRAFYELAEREIIRACRQRSPVTISYLDIDNFKAVNDNFGHNAGDDLLRTIAEVISESLRETDLLARLGGDEFALLLPDTSYEAAQAVMPKIRYALQKKMEEKQYPVTFSIGSLTCVMPPHSMDEIIKMADNLMYSVKNSGKNSIRYSLYQGK